MENFKKILVQRADRLGDTILSFPVIEELKKKYPNAEIHMLTSPLGKKITKLHPLISKVLTIDLSRSKFFQLLTIMPLIKKEKYDCYISLWNDSFIFGYIGWVAQIPVRIGELISAKDKLFFTDPVSISWGDLTKHQIDFNLMFLKPLSITPKDIITKIYNNNDTLLEIQHKIKYLPYKKTLCIFTDSGGSNTFIPEDTWLKFIKLIQEKKKYNIIILYGKTEFPILETLTDNALLNITDFLEIPDLISYIEASDIYIAADTGPTHVASFLNKPMVCYFGKSGNLPARWGPVSDFFEIYKHTDENPISGKNLSKILEKLELRLSQKNKNNRHNDCFIKSIKILTINRNNEETTKALNKESPIEIIKYSLKNKATLKDGFKIINTIKKEKITLIASDVLPNWLYKFMKFYIAAILASSIPLWIKKDIKNYSTETFIEEYKYTLATRYK